MTSQFPLSGPLSVGDLLDRTFRLYRARFGTFLLTAAIFLVPLALVSGLLTGTFITDYLGALELLASQSGGPTEEQFSGLFTRLFGYFGALALIALLSLALGGIVTLALTAQNVAALHGRALSVGQGIRQGLGRFWAYVWMVIVQWLLTFAATLAVMIPVILFFGVAVFGGALAGISLGETSEAAGLISAIGIVVLVLCGYALLFVVILAPIVYLSARWFVAPAALMAEELGPLDALRRSWWLSHENTRRVIGFVVLLYILMALVLSFPAALFQQILIAVMPTAAIGLATSLSTAVSSLLSVLGTPFFTTALVLLYYDLRVRREGYDLELRIRALEAAQDSRAPGPDMPAPDVPAPDVPAPAPPEESDRA